MLLPLRESLLCSSRDEKESKEIEFNKKTNRVQLYVCVIGDLLARNILQQVLFDIIARELSSLRSFSTSIRLHEAACPSMHSPTCHNRFDAPISLARPEYIIRALLGLWCVCTHIAKLAAFHWIAFKAKAQSSEPWNKPSLSLATTQLVFGSDAAKSLSLAHIKCDMC